MKQLSRQRAWQLRKQQAGQCVTCGRPAEPGRTRCFEHREQNKRYLAEYRAG